MWVKFCYELEKFHEKKIHISHPYRSTVRENIYREIGSEILKLRWGRFRNFLNTVEFIEGRERTILLLSLAEIILHSCLY
jgi:hypothetical protein